MSKWTVYMYTLPNGKRYIGATKRTLSARQGSDESGWHRYKNCRLLWEAIQEFGIDSIEQTILFKGEITDKEAAEMERYYIALYKTNANKYNNPTYGYNSGDGGEGIHERHISDQRKAQLVEQMKELRAKRVGEKASDRTRLKQRNAKLGIKHPPMSAETRRKIGLANSLAMISDEERQHRSDSKKQPVIASNPLTGEKLYFRSGDEAAEYFGVRPSSISRWIQGLRHPRNGYCFAKANSGVVA